jgi:SAM-dependent methyltransferase
LQVITTLVHSETKLKSSGTLQRINLGCPNFCEGYICVDKDPHDPHVIKANVYEYLSEAVDQGNKFDSIYSKNLLEHLGDPLQFLILCRRALKSGGTLKLVTDNAEFFPYYIPIALVGTGLGGHSTNTYALGMNHSVHMTVFTKLHLRNLLLAAGFDTVSVRRLPKVLFARLEAQGKLL